MPGGPHPDSDIVDLIVHDHDVLKHLFARFTDDVRPAWGMMLPELTGQLVRHEVAEERVVYPALRMDTLPGPALADALLAEQAEAEELLHTLVKLPPESDSFAVVLDRLRSVVLEHARDEEQHLVPLLQNLEADVRRWELGARYARAVAAAPTHPHPHAPDRGPANVVVSPLIAFVDHVRDAVRSASGSG